MEGLSSQASGGRDARTLMATDKRHEAPARCGAQNPGAHIDGVIIIVPLLVACRFDLSKILPAPNYQPRGERGITKYSSTSLIPMLVHSPAFWGFSSLVLTHAWNTVACIT